MDLHVPITCLFDCEANSYSINRLVYIIVENQNEVLGEEVYNGSLADTIMLQIWYRSLGFWSDTVFESWDSTNFEEEIFHGYLESD